MKHQELFESILQEAPLPETWDKNQFSTRASFRQTIAYAKERAKQIGRGSSRVAFEIPYQGRKTVLKVALNNKGIAQNQEEADLLSDWYLKSIGIAIPLIDYDEENGNKISWIHTEFAQKITKRQLARFFDGIGIDAILASIEYERTGRKNHMYRELPESIYENDTYERLRELLLSYDKISSGDLGRTVNWGIYKGKPVIVDLGFTDNTVHLYR